MKKIPVVLTGYGNVGRAFYKLVHDKAEDIRRRYDLDLEVTAVFRSAGGAVLDRGMGEKFLLGGAPAGLESLPTWKPGLRPDAVLRAGEPGVLAETTPSNFQTGEPGLSYMRTALDRGWSIAAASKGALVVDYAGLMGRASSRGASIRFSGATAAALPTLDVGLMSFAGADIQGIDGILTGTTNHILGRLEAGLTFEAALKEAQEKGIAEPDPSLDIDGWDTACKLLLIANAAAGTAFRMGDIRVEGIRGVGPERLKKARAAGRTLKLLGRLTREDGAWRPRVEPIEIDSSHPLYRIDGTNKGIVFFTDTMGTVILTGGRSDPRGTAAAVLKDIINIHRR